MLAFVLFMLIEHFNIRPPSLSSRAELCQVTGRSHAGAEKNRNVAGEYEGRFAEIKENEEDKRGNKYVLVIKECGIKASIEISHPVLTIEDVKARETLLIRPVLLLRKRDVLCGCTGFASPTKLTIKKLFLLRVAIASRQSTANVRFFSAHILHCQVERVKAAAAVKIEPIQARRSRTRSGE